MPPSVLIVEDDFLIAEDHRSVIEDMGWTVIGPAHNVAEALELLADLSPSIAVLDFQLGQEVVTPVALVLQSRNIPFVAASGVTDMVAIGGEVFRDVPNLGKMLDPARLSGFLG